MKNYIQKTLVLLACSLSIISCRKDKELTTIDAHENHDHVHSSMAFHLEHKFGEETFYLDSIYYLENGVQVKLSRVEFYLSNPHVYSEEDSIIDNYGRKYILVNPETIVYELGNVDFTQDHLHKLSFHLGVDSLTNHTDPTTYSSSHALSLQTPSMHWAWSSGYRFMVLSGSADVNNDGIFENNFDYHIGSDPFLIADTFHLHKNITTMGLTIQLNLDYRKLFSNLDLSTDLSTHTMDNMPLANKIKDNMENFISYIE